MAVARTSKLEQVQDQQLPMVQSALVIGGGVAGMVAALNLAAQGFPTHLVETTDKLGGNAWKLSHTLKGEDIPSYLNELTKRVQDEPGITIYFKSKVKDVQGFVGAFKTEIAGDDGTSVVIDHGVAVIATGASEWKPNL